MHRPLSRIRLFQVHRNRQTIDRRSNRHRHKLKPLQTILSTAGVVRLKTFSRSFRLSYLFALPALPALLYHPLLPFFASIISYKEIVIMPTANSLLADSGEFYLARFGR